MYRNTFVEIDRAALHRNFQQYHNILPPGGELMAVVKADGYGHGAIEVSKIAETEGVTWLGVATLDEGIALREAGIELSILVLGPWTIDSIPGFSEHHLTPLVYSLESAEGLQAHGEASGIYYCVHLKVDTGMGRLGLNREQLNTFLGRSWPNLLVEGITSHLAQADSGIPQKTLGQIHRFWAINEGIDAHFMPRWLHLANSAATSEFIEDQGNLFRVGIGLYGQMPSKTLLSPPTLQQAMSFKTQVLQLQWFEPNTPLGYGATFTTDRKTKVACIGVGYADGYARGLSNRAEVLIRGHRAPVVGTVCMDITLVDVTDIPEVALEDEVVLIGRQGDQEIFASELAEILGTINYEICCAISKRVPRIYRN